MKRLALLLMTVALMAVAAVSVIIEFFPQSRAAERILPVCEGPYRLGKAQVVRLYAHVRAEIVRASEGRSGPEASPAEPVAAVEPEYVAPAAEAKIEAEPVELAKAHWYSRARVSESACRGKVVLGCVWSLPTDEAVELIGKVRRIADGFSGKRDLVIFGTHCGGRSAEVESFVSGRRFDFPVCEEAVLPCARRATGSAPCLYLVDKKGNLRYVGRNDKSVLTLLAELF